MTTQQARTPEGFLLIAKIKHGQLDEMRTALAESQNYLDDPEGPLEKIGTVHYARMAIIADTHLLFASWFDGDAIAYLDDFFTTSNNGARFDLIFRYTEGWPGPNDRDGFVNFWMSHRIQEVTYRNYPGVTAKEVQKALRIRHNLEAVLQDFQ